MIDAHFHLWEPTRGDYDWMPKGDPILDRRYVAGDVRPQMALAGVEGAILVQAAATLAETEYMLGLADATPWILGVVGWIDFEDRHQGRVLERLAKHPKFRGVRPMIQDIPDDDWMLRHDIAWAFKALGDLDLTFDALGFPRHLPNFLRLLDRHPHLRVVLDHAAKPQVRDPGGYDAWADGIARLAAETGACVKLSGLVTEADPGWSVEDLRPYVTHLLHSFGPERIMWGSDWPVCRLRAEYADWREAAEALVADRTPDERAAIFGGTARGFYRV